MADIFDNDLFMNLLMALGFILVIIAIICIVMIFKKNSSSKTLGWESFSSNIGTKLSNI